MNNDTQPATGPSPVLPVEAEVRADDLETPSPDDAGTKEADDSKVVPGKDENAPGFLKPPKK